MKNSIIKIRKPKLLNICGICSIFLVWFLISELLDNSIIIPKVYDVFKALIEMLSISRIYVLVFKLLLNGLMTIFSSFVIGLLMAIISYKSENFYNFINPIITLLKTIPIIAIVILLLISVMSLAPYIASSLVIIPIIFEGVYMSLKQIDSNITDDIKTLSNFNFKIAVKFYIPLIIPNIVTSLIQSFGLGLKVLVMAEFTSPMNNSYGAEIKRFYDNNDMAKVYVMVIILILLSFLVDKVLKVVRKKYE